MSETDKWRKALLYWRDEIIDAHGSVNKSEPIHSLLVCEGLYRAEKLLYASLETHGLSLDEPKELCEHEWRNSHAHKKTYPLVCTKCGTEKT